MKDEQAVAICDELRKLISSGPGKNHMALNQARGVLSRCTGDANASIREKAGDVDHDFNLWFTLRRWRKFGDELHFRAKLNDSIENLSIALASHHGK